MSQNFETCYNKRELDMNNEFKEYSNVHDIDGISSEVTKIGREILRITLMVKQKNIKDINKNFQATLTNYFLECYVCTLLLKHMGLQYKRDVKKKIEAFLKIESDDISAQQKCHISFNSVLNNDEMNRNNIQKNKDLNFQDDISDEKLIKQTKKIAKYVRLIKAYEEQIRRFKLENEYTSMLIGKINEDVDCFPKDSQKYITQYQKKLCALLILQHFLTGQNKNNLKSFCELWNSIFTNLPLYYFARENNIFYNKVKLGEENDEQQHLQQLIIGASNINQNCKQESNEQSANNLKQIQSNLQKMNKQDGSHGIFAMYKVIQQQPPNVLSYDLEFYHSSKGKIQQPQQSKSLHSQDPFSKLDENNSDSPNNLISKEIKVNCFPSPKLHKQKEICRKKVLLINQLVKYNENPTKLQKKNNKDSDQTKQSNKEQYQKMTNSQFCIIQKEQIGDSSQQCQTQSQLQLSSEQKSNLKQANYRFI